jgi:ribosome biogenesis protein UTP30
VLGVSKLRSNYKTYEARRKLFKSFDLFLADRRVLLLLPALLGKPFYEKKKCVFAFVSLLFH